MPIGSVVFPEGLLEAKDADAGINALVEYKVVPSSFSHPSAHSGGGGGGGANDDGYGTFHFASPHQPIVTLVKPLDYESVRRYTLTVVASVSCCCCCCCCCVTAASTYYPSTQHQSIDR